MLKPFKEPEPSIQYDPQAEIAVIDKHFAQRSVPKSQDSRLLVASWNIANLGAQSRPERALPISSHILSRFDVVAVQEVNDNYRTFEKIVLGMEGDFDFVMSDTAGNDERLAFVYRKNKVQLGKLWGEVALRPYQYPKRTVEVHYREDGEEKTDIFTDHKFVPFDRNPFIGSFKCENFDFVLTNVHLYYGSFERSSNPKIYSALCKAGS